MKRTDWQRILAMAIAWMMTALCMSAALAEETQAGGNPRLELSTRYPSMVVKAGDNLTFDLDIDNQSGLSQDVALSISEMPEGWTGSFSASSRQVSIVHVKDGEAHTGVDFALDIPLEAQDGEYTVKLKADGGKFTDVMELVLVVDAEEIGDSSFEVEYPSQEGDTGTDFTFDATLINNTLSTQSYAFSVSAPDGWKVEFLPSGENTKVAALDVEARKTQALDISVTPPDVVEAGEYAITCTATSADEKMSIDLSVTITGSYGLEMSTPSGRLSLDAYANKESAIQLTLTNTGNTELTNVNLTSSAPTGWNIRFENSSIDLIEAGATVETTAYITPGEDAMSGDYAATIKVNGSRSLASDSIELRITVKTETVWGVTGMLIIVLLAAALAGVMKKYGRR